MGQLGKLSEVQQPITASKCTWISSRKQKKKKKKWINEIPTVPIYYLAKPQPRERAWQNQRGKKT
ncbi:hypothetical protein GGU10DRAFT_280215, partial [Lentinula aff. detonsa]